MSSSIYLRLVWSSLITASLLGEPIYTLAWSSFTLDAEIDLAYDTDHVALPIRFWNTASER